MYLSVCYNIIPYYTILYNTILYYIIRYSMILFYTIQYYTILYHLPSSASCLDGIPFVVYSKNKEILASVSLELAHCMLSGSAVPPSDFNYAFLLKSKTGVNITCSYLFNQKFLVIIKTKP